MKLASYLLDGRASYGVVEGKGIIDLGRRIGARHPDLRALITAKALDEARTAAAGAKPDTGLDQIAFLPVIPNPDKIVCVGLNYEEHRVETNRDKTENPALFLRVPGSQVGHWQPLLRPRESKMLDYEGEIAVIIGTGGRRIPESDAWRHIVGYACYNDGSVRDWQRHTVQWTAGKNFARTGPFGPWMVTADEIPPEHGAHARHASERDRDAARDDRDDDLQDPPAHQLHLDLRRTRPRRRDRDRHARRGRRAADAAGVDESRRQGRDRDRQGRRAREHDRRRLIRQGISPSPSKH